MKNTDHSGLLEKVGLKKTEGRMALLYLLAHSKKPLSAKAIAAKLEKGGADQVTVYRMLETFGEHGIVRRVETGSREAQYELVDQEDHHHLICLSCKKVSDFTGCDADGLIKKALKQSGEFSSVSHHSFDLYGRCLACKKKERPTSDRS